MYFDIEISICQVFYRKFYKNKNMEPNFDEILKEFMILKNLTQTAFANAIGVKQSQVSEWLNGKAKPGYDTLRRISLAFNVSADYFLGLKESFY